MELRFDLNVRGEEKNFCPFRESKKILRSSGQ